MAIRHQRCSKLGQRHREPLDKKGDTNKPLKQRRPINLHHCQRNKETEQGNAESSHSETAIHKEIGGIGTQTTYGIAKFLRFVGQIALSQILNDALVSSSRREKRDKCPRQTDGQCKEQHAQKEVQAFVLKYLNYIFNTQ